MEAEEAGLLPDQNSLLDGIAFWMSATQMGANEKSLIFPHQASKVRLQLHGLDPEQHKPPKPKTKRAKRNYKT